MNKLVTKITMIAFALSMLGTINSHAQGWLELRRKEISKVSNIFYAIEHRGDTETIKKLIDATDTANLNIRNLNNYTLLHMAVTYNRKGIVKHLMDKGANPNVFNNINNAPIHTAIYDRNLGMVKVLVENGADINLKDKKANNHDTPLTLAINVYQYTKYEDNIKERKRLRKATTDIAKYLVDAGADLNIKNADGFTPFQLASYTSQKEIAKYISEERNWVHQLFNGVYYHLDM